MRSLLPLLLLLAACPPTSVDTSDTSDTSDTHDSTDTSDTAPANDRDQDGWATDQDCDDDDPLVHPTADEICDGKDSDCAGGPAYGEGDVNGDGLLDCLRCDAAGYWEGTKLLGDKASLQAALDTLEPTLSCSYSSATNYMFLRLDNDGGWVECVYTGRTTAVTNQKPDATDMNTEHSWPQSQGADVEPARCDLHHLYPTDANANSKRGDNPFGVVTGTPTWSQGGSKLGKDSSGTTVFEPRDVHKGNVARSMLYFAQRYNKSLSSAQIALFRAWDAADPVDAAEWARTESIAEDQAYANPFVACPDLVPRAW